MGAKVIRINGMVIPIRADVFVSTFRAMERGVHSDYQALDAYTVINQGPPPGEAVWYHAPRRTGPGV